MSSHERATPEYDLVIKAPRLVGTEGEASASIGVRGATVAAVEPLDAPLRGAEIVRLAADEVLMPGLVDSHVHVNDPGRGDWEGFPSATRAAAAGGITTIIDMPLNSIPPTVDVAALETKRDAAAGQCFVDTGFWGGAVPGNRSRLRGLHDSGVYGFKCFLLPSGVDEFPPLEPAELERVMREVRSFDGLVIVHAEDAGIIDSAPAAHGKRYRDFLNSRPRAAENRAIERVVALARETGCRAHILHVSSAEALDTIAEAKRAGIRITAETCPHYLALRAEEIADGATAFKCCPPIREESNRERLWQGLADGTIDIVVSDHSPSTPDLKRLDTGDFAAAWGGVSSLQLSLPVVWSEVRARGFALADVARWMSLGPAELSGLERKGRIELGYDADFCVFAPDESQIVNARRLRHKHPVTPYAEHTLTGVVRAGWLRGGRVCVDGLPGGTLLSRGEV